MTLRSFKRGLVLFVICSLPPVGWITFDYACRPRLAAGPMVQLLQPESFVLVWDLPGRVPELEIMQQDGSPAGTLELERSGAATIRGLSPRTEYTYRLQYKRSGRTIVIHEDRVRTAPAPMQPFRFLALGDTGDGERHQMRIASRLLDHDADLVIHTGDVVYDRGEAADYAAKFYRPYADLLARLPMYAVLGNHDVRNSEEPELKGRPFLDAFRLPENGPEGQTPEREYWFDFGAARFVALDSNRETQELAAFVAPWLDAALASAEGRWKFVVVHEPPFTHGGHAPADKIREVIVPVLDRHGVHVVLSGHNHMYERTHPIRGGDIAPEGQGTVYIITGAGGAGLYEERLPVPSYMAAWYHARHSFTVVDVGEEQLRIRQINDLGETVDTAVIVRGAAEPAT